MGGHIVQGHVDATGTVAAVAEDGIARRLTVEVPADLRRYVVERGSVALDGVSLTVAALDRHAAFEVSLSPRRSSARRSATRRRGGSSTSRWTCSPATSSDSCQSSRTEEQPDDRKPDGTRDDDSEGSRRGQPLRDDRGGDRGDPPRPHGRRLRRRGPRERGRPRARGPVRHSRGGQLHGQGGARADLPGADPGALRRARPRPDGGQERGAAADRVHGLDRGRRGRHDRDLGARPRPHRPGRDRPALEARGPRPARPRLPAQGQGGRRARAHRPHRGEHRPRPALRPDPGRRDLRDHERGRDDGPGPRPRRRTASGTGSR